MALNPTEQALADQLTAAADPAAPSLAELVAQQGLDAVKAQMGFFDDADYSGDEVLPHQDIQVPMRDGVNITVRLFNQDLPAAGPLLVYYPGNGYFFPSYFVNGVFASRIAKQAGIRVASVHFRLVPENPMPTPVHDGYDALVYLLDRAEQFGIDVDNVFLGGISSGAHCAAMVSYMLRDSRYRIKRQLLLNGLYDLTCSNNDFADYEAQDVICDKMSASSQYIFDCIAGSHDRKDPVVSPYWQPDMTDLPPTSIIVAEYDGVRSESEAYYKKLKAAGVPVDKVVLEGQTHNAAILRKVLSGGIDPAQVFAEIITAHTG